MGLTSCQKVGIIISGIECLKEQEKLNLVERLTEENVPTGYITMGCFGSFFSEQESSYTCDSCGVHWTEAKINNFNDLEDYALLKSIGELICDVNNESEFKSVYEEDREWLKYMYISSMCIVLDEYDISDEELYKKSFEYWKSQEKETE